MITRRDAIRLGGLGILGAAAPSFLLGKITFPPARSRRLFFKDEDLPAIRANARTVLLGPTFRSWEARAPEALETAWQRFRQTGNIVSDLLKVWTAFTETALVQMVEPSSGRRAALLASIEEAIALPKWDYMLSDGEVIGIMRSSLATSSLLFAREALGGRLENGLDERLLDAIAEKGVMPCYRTLQEMNNPEQAGAWRFSEGENPMHEIDLSRWPQLLGSNNLRAVPTMAVGLGALALEGRDARASEWLDLAVASSRDVFSLFFGDGSFFEGLSYADYTLRTLLMFCDAHYRVKGTIDWSKEMNFPGFIEFVAATQAGRTVEGVPDIVNFSDARTSLFPCVGGWIARETGDRLAQYVTEHFSGPGSFLDYLWYRPGLPSAAPRAELQNYRSESDWLVSRSGWRPDDAVLAFRSGMPANHEHADRNSFLFKVYGERLLTDHFGAAYNRESPLWTLRLTQAHNAVLIGGQGHQYHKGEEGVNESQSEARVVRYRDQGRQLWWSSDATQAYRLVNASVSKVVRTVAFAKPNVVVVYDQVRLANDAEEVEVRYFPDNRDGAARLSVDGHRFVISRPNASLHGACAASGKLKLRAETLDLYAHLSDAEKRKAKQTETELGSYPFVSLSSRSASTHGVLSVMVARSSPEAAAPDIAIEWVDRGWYFAADGVTGMVAVEGEIPEILWT